VPGDEPSLVEKVVRLDASLTQNGIGHAFGGALALAYHTRNPRATADIDVNINVGAPDARAVFEALPDGVAWNDNDLAAVVENEQVRLWWGRNPIDLFFRAATFHDGVADRAELHPFADRRLPFLAANDLAVFKALFDRPKDWVDIAAMVDAGSVDVEAVTEALMSLVGADDRVERLRTLVV
jgi:hypothetical protein